MVIDVTRLIAQSKQKQSELAASQARYEDAVAALTSLRESTQEKYGTHDLATLKSILSEKEQALTKAVLEAQSFVDQISSQ